MSRAFNAIRIGLVLSPLLVVGAAAAPASAASWGDAYAGATSVRFEADRNVVNSLVITRSGRTVTIDDRVRIKPGRGCRQASGDITKVLCTTTQAPVTVSVDLWELNDTVLNKSDLRLEAQGGPGADTIVGGPKADSLYGDAAFAQYGNDKIYGGGGSDFIAPGDGSDFVSGGDGNDSIQGDTDYVDPKASHPGNDVIYGGNGDDHLFDVGGTNWLFGENGNDGLVGGTYRDTLDGGPGNDTFRGDWDPARSGADVFRGGAGVDELRYDGNRPVTVDLDGASGDDGAAGERDSAGTDIENLIGGRGNDTLIGNAARNEIEGAEGNDTIIGGAGDDQLRGSEGDDRFWGLDGNDTIETGSGVNRADGGPGTDTCISRVLEDAIISCEDHRPW